MFSTTHKCVNSKLLLVLLPFLLISCSTLEKSQRWGKVAQIAARRGTLETVKRHPEYRPIFASVAAGINGLLIGDTLSYQALLTELQKLPIKELKGDEGALLFRDAVDIVDGILGETLKLEDASNLKPFAAGIANGITEGLQLSLPGPPSPTGWQRRPNQFHLTGKTTRTYPVANLAAN